jgi:hypothetical protein
MADLRPQEGFDALDKMGRIREIEAGDYSEVAKEYARVLKEGKTSLIACPTHSEGAKISSAVRLQLREEGLIGKDDIILPRLVPLQWDDAERGDVHNYQPGMVAHFFTSIRKWKAGEKVVVTAQNAPELSKTAAEERAGRSSPERPRFQVYRQDVLPVALGEKLRVTRNGKTKDGTHIVSNGEIITVKGLTKSGDLIDHRGWVLKKDFEHLAGGHVVTAIPSQGKTLDRPIGVATAESYPSVRADWQYVTSSRGREPILLFTDEKARLRELVKREDKRISAIELMREPRKPWLRRTRERISRLRERAMVAVGVATKGVQKNLGARELSYGR